MAPVSRLGYRNQGELQHPFSSEDPSDTLHEHVWLPAGPCLISRNSLEIRQCIILCIILLLKTWPSYGTLCNLKPGFDQTHGRGQVFRGHLQA